MTARIEYHTELMAVREAWLSRTSVNTQEAAGPLTTRFNELAAAGWDLIAMSPVPVVGKLWASATKRDPMTLAVFRRPRSEGRSALSPQPKAMRQPWPDR